MFPEGFKAIPEYPDYAVSASGQVYSSKSDMLLKPFTIGGYKVVSLRWKESGKRVHRLVYEMFAGEIEKGMTIIHKDGNRSNNNVDNLTKVSHAYNIKRSYDSKEVRKRNRDKIKKISKKDIEEMKALKRQGWYTIPLIAEKYNLSIEKTRDILK